MDKRYAKEMIKLAEEAKQSLNIRKEIILDNTTTNEQLGEIVRQMYRAKAEAENTIIERCKQHI